MSWETWWDQVLSAHTPWQGIWLAIKACLEMGLNAWRGKCWSVLMDEFWEILFRTPSLVLALFCHPQQQSLEKEKKQYLGLSFTVLQPEGYNFDWTLIFPPGLFGQISTQEGDWLHTESNSSPSCSMLAEFRLGSNQLHIPLLTPYCTWANRPGRV